MSLLLNGDCLEQLSNVCDNSVDFIFCDLPYGQTSCKWDIIVPWEPFWKEIMRVKKLNTPVFFTTTTKFGVQLINSAPKKMPFRYDLVWVKSANCGFLQSRKMPMRKHEMVYCFYEKLPFYDLSSHQHKFLKEEKYVKEEGSINNYKAKRIIYTDEDGNKIKEGQSGPNQTKYDPPLPTSVVKEEKKARHGAKQSTCSNECYQDKKLVMGDDWRKVNGGVKIYDPPLPTSVVKEDKYANGTINSNTYDIPNKSKGGMYRSPAGQYDPPLPTTMLEIKSTRGKHSTEKPVALMEWLLKYYSKEGDTVLDPTMGSGSTGVACKNMKRNFIGIEKDPDIYQVAVNRIED